MRGFIKWTVILIVLLGAIFAVGEYLKFQDGVKQAKAAENFLILMPSDQPLEEKLISTVDPMGKWDPGSENYINASKLFKASGGNPFSYIIYNWRTYSKILNKVTIHYIFMNLICTTFLKPFNLLT